MNLQTVEIQKRHLQQIYDHLDLAIIRTEKLETLGYWVASAYEIDE